MVSIPKGRFEVRFPFLLVLPLAVVSLVFRAAGGRLFAGQSGQTAERRERSASQPAPESGPSLLLGETARPRDREATVPLYFRARQGEAVGTIQAELAPPGPPWKFQKGEAPREAWWKVSGKRKEEKPQKGPGSEAIELTISAGRRALPEGLIGYLRFRAESPAAAAPEGLAVRRFETVPPAKTANGTAPAEEFPPLSAEPPLNPAQGCFFFTH